MLKSFPEKSTDKDRQTQLREDAKIKEAEKVCACKYELINQRKTKKFVKFYGAGL